MYTSFQIELKERAVVLHKGLPFRALGPGKHSLWGFDFELLRFNTEDLLCGAPAEVRAVMPEGWIAEVLVGLRQRALLYRDSKPALFLRPGAYRYWVVDPTVRLELLSLDEPVPELSEDALRIIPGDELVDVTVAEHQRGLLYCQGRFDRVLLPGRYLFWSPQAARTSVRVVDMRRQQLTIAGQELMTRDKVTLRLSLVVEYAPTEPSTAVHVISNPEQALYTQVQLAARDYVASVTLEELLEAREAMTRYLTAHTVPQAERIGIRIEQVGVKDVVLPGEMKTLLNKVIEAEKQAAANVILRREEAAATRALANAARVMDEQPTLIRLKELETLEHIAQNVRELRLVVGLKNLEQLLVTPTQNQPTE